jgi:hypothetical protein
MRVYHGSDTLISVIDLQKCKPNRDFGRGFYVTKLRSQADEMVKRVTRWSKKPLVVTEFEFDEYAYEDSDLQAHDYDIVEGNVADDKITRNITKYLKGDILKDEFLEMLKHSEPNHQICFCTVNSLQMLDYVENPKDIEYEISEIGEPLIEQLIIDRQIDEQKATDLFYNSRTFTHLADESTELYKKPWQEIYELLKLSFARKS